MQNYKFDSCKFDDWGKARSLPNWYKEGTNMSAQECAENADKNNAKYFAMQYYEGDGNKNTGQCFYGDSYINYGPKDNCITTDDGNRIGGADTNAMYIRTTPKSIPIDSGSPSSPIPSLPTPVPLMPNDSESSDNSLLMLGVYAVVAILIILVIVIVLMKLLKK